MGERFHHACVADPRRLAELSRAAEEAVTGRDPAPLEAFLLRYGGERDPDWDGDLVARALGLCTVAGWDADIGVQEHFVGWEGFISGEALVPMAEATDDPPDELLTRALARFGQYSAHHGLELLLEDWQRFAYSFGHYFPPVWARATRCARRPSSSRRRPPSPTRTASSRATKTARPCSGIATRCCAWPRPGSPSSSG